MNFLGHAILSPPEAGIIAGNIAGDFFHGNKQYLNTTEEIKQGVIRHRAIDSFTDINPNVLKANKIFHEDFGKYAPVITDILWDYYIAHDPEYFINQDALISFSREIYKKINAQLPLLPAQFQQIFPNMSENDWLSGSYYKDRIMRAFKHLAQRAHYWPKDYQIIEHLWLRNNDELHTHYQNLKLDFKKQNLINFNK